MFRYKVVEKGDTFLSHGENVKGNNKMDVLLVRALEDVSVSNLKDFTLNHSVSAPPHF